MVQLALLCDLPIPKVCTSIPVKTMEAVETIPVIGGCCHTLTEKLVWLPNWITFLKILNVCSIIIHNIVLLMHNCHIFALQERNTIPSVPVYTFVREEEGGLTRQKAYEGKDQMIKEAMENIGNAPSEDVDCSQDAPLSINRLESIPLDTQRNGLSAETSTGLLSF